MKKLDRSRAFGRITPPYEPSNFDRPAFYFQDGRYYDQHDQLIEPGKPLRREPPPPPPPPVVSGGAGNLATGTPNGVGGAGGSGSKVGAGGGAGGADSGGGGAAGNDQGGGAAEFHPLDHDKNGKKGGSLPADKKTADKLTAQDLINNPNLPWMTFRRAAMRILGPSCPASKTAILSELQKAVNDVDAYASEQRTAAATKKIRQPKGDPGPVKVKGGREVDLAAWARGQKDYLWGDVQKAIRQQFHRQVTARRDALETLIEEHVIPADQARKDIK